MCFNLCLLIYATPYFRIFKIANAGSNAETFTNDNMCPQDSDLFHEGSCYRPVTTEDSFDNANDNCPSVVTNSHIVTIGNQ